MSSGRNHLRLHHEGGVVVATVTIPGQMVGYGVGGSDVYDPDTEHCVMLFQDRCRELAITLLEKSVKPGALSVIKDLIRENKVTK